MLSTLNSLFISAVNAGTPLLLGELGEILTEKAGNMNLSVEGKMFMVAITVLRTGCGESRGRSKRRPICADRAVCFFSCRGAWSVCLCIPYDFSAGESERDRSDAYDLWYGIREFLW